METKLAVHQLEGEVVQLKDERQRLNAENENMSKSESDSSILFMSGVLIITVA